MTVALVTGAARGIGRGIGADHDGLDLVVANACNGNARPFAPAPFWDLAPQHWDEMLTIGVRSHLETASRAAPLLIARLATALAHDLRPHGVTAVALAPGFTQTEAITGALGPNPPGSDPVAELAA